MTFGGEAIAAIRTYLNHEQTHFARWLVHNILYILYLFSYYYYI